jgi:hypothetical protein
VSDLVIVVDVLLKFDVVLGDRRPVHLAHVLGVTVDLLSQFLLVDLLLDALVLDLLVLLDQLHVELALVALGLAAFGRLVGNRRHGGLRGVHDVEASPLESELLTLLADDLLVLAGVAADVVLGDWLVLGLDLSEFVEPLLLSLLVLIFGELLLDLLEQLGPLGDPLGLLDHALLGDLSELDAVLDLLLDLFSSFLLLRLLGGLFLLELLLSVLEVLRELVGF